MTEETLELRNSVLSKMVIELQSQLTEKDNEIDYQKQARSIAENAVVECTNELKEKDKQLNEAKEIIKDLLDILFINDCAIPSKSKERAEQFLGVKL